MPTPQPDWELVANLGDASPADYGAFLVYRDKTGVYPPEAEVYVPDNGGLWGQMYRFVLEPPRFKTQIANAEWATEADFKNPKMRGVKWRWYNEWFVRTLPLVVDASDVRQFRILRQLLSTEPIDRGRAYQAIAGYYGYHEFDHSGGVHLTEEEAQARYKVIKN